jgi:imidazolonepropionase-like amidohydrolase
VATWVAAELLRAEGQFGTLAAGAYAEVIMLDGDSLEGIGPLADPAAHMPLVVQAGAVVRQR